jgi:hypothetical protein
MDKEEVFRFLNLQMEKCVAWEMSCTRSPEIDTTSPEAIQEMSKGFKHFKLGPKTIITLELWWNEDAYQQEKLEREIKWGLRRI